MHIVKSLKNLGFFFLFFIKKVLLDLKFGKAITTKLVLLKIVILYNFQIICSVLEQSYVVFESFPPFTAIADPCFGDLSRFQFVKFPDV